MPFNLPARNFESNSRPSERSQTPATKVLDFQQALERSQPDAPLRLEQAVIDARVAMKDGDIDRAMALTKPLFDQYPENKEVCVSRGWALFKALKPVDIKDNRTALELLQALRPLLPRLAQPGLLPSLLLMQACRFIKEIPIASAIIWENRAFQFRTEDFNRYDYKDDKGRPQQSPSLVEKITRASVNIALADEQDPQIRKQKLDWAKSLIAEHAQRYADNIWMTLDQVKLAIATGEHLDEAQTQIQALLRQKPRDFWAWETAAKLATDPEMKIACLCRAVSCPGAKPEFLVKVRTQLAREIFKQGHLPEAKCEIEQVVAIRERFEWKIPPSITEFRSRPDYKAAVAPKDNNVLYETWLPRTEQILSLKHMQPRQRRPDAGLPHSKERDFAGPASLHERGFAFVEDVFISPTLVTRHGLRNGDIVTGRAISSLKPGTAETGWKAIEIS